MQIAPIHCNSETLPWQTVFGFLYLRCTLPPLGEYEYTTEPYVCGGDAALCQITLTTCYYYYCKCVIIRQGSIRLHVLSIFVTRVNRCVRTDVTSKSDSRPNDTAPSYHLRRLQSSCRTHGRGCNSSFHPITHSLHFLANVLTTTLVVQVELSVGCVCVCLFVSRCPDDNFRKSKL